jgi:hypothetical protein
MVSTNAHLRLIDRPCGTGKTSQMLKSFQEDRCYLVILPTLCLTSAPNGKICMFEQGSVSGSS